MSQVFLSYSRQDDEPFVKQIYEDLTKNNIDIWWDREAMESRGRTFLQELRDAIEASDRVITVIGPNAVHSVGKETGQTAHQERWCNTLRQRVARFVRKTLSFSKSETNHELVTRWFIIQYNLKVRPSLTKGLLRAGKELCLTESYF